MIYRRYSNKRAGFTLTELAIVLGVIGTILGAIWTASGRVNDANKTQKAAGEVLQILNNYRSLYAQRGVDVADWTDTTCTGVNANFFPSDMASGVTCVNGTTTTYPISPWGGYVQIWGYQSNQGVVIGYYNLPQAACNNLAAAMTTSTDVIWENINGSNQWANGVNSGGAAYTVGQINGFCGAGSGDYLQIMYKAR